MRQLPPLLQSVTAGLTVQAGVRNRPRCRCCCMHACQLAPADPRLPGMAPLAALPQAPQGCYTPHSTSPLPVSSQASCTAGKGLTTSYASKIAGFGLHVLACMTEEKLWVVGIPNSGDSLALYQSMAMAMYTGQQLRGCLQEAGFALICLSDLIYAKRLLRKSWSMTAYTVLDSP